MQFIKKTLAILFLFVFIICLVIFREPLIDFTGRLIVHYDHSRQGAPNEYKLTFDFKFIENVDLFEPNNKDDLINIYYTIINSGNTRGSFYCPRSYNDCLKDVRSISRDSELLSHVNNYVHPFNSFRYITTRYNNMRKVTIELAHNYTEDQITKINAEVNRIEAKLINDEMTKEQKIRAVHDHIINNSRYDQGRANQDDFTYRSDLAYGPLFQGKGICSGFSDAMAIFLNRWNIPNFRVASANHIWNLVYVNNNWYHLDVTWNNPVMPDGSDVLDHTFFLITNTRLQEIDTNQHDFPKDIYPEAI